MHGPQDIPYHIPMKSEPIFDLGTAESFCLLTLGCKINQYETQALREAWKSRGLTERTDARQADIVVINACAVTSKASADVRAAARAAHRANPEARIVVVGCVASEDRELLEALPGVCAVLSQRAKAALAGNPGETSPFPPLSISDYPRARAVLKVQDGCSHGCSYCIVPSTRGAAVSRPTRDVVAEARRLLDAGFREITLSGVNLRLYGSDFGESLDFWGLVRHIERELAPEWAGSARLRLSSLDPALLTDQGLETLAESRLLCPHLHLSLQSLAPSVLTRMRRGHYGPATVFRFLERLSGIWPVFGLGADFICGFPGETEVDAETTREAMAALPLTYAHVFPYSPRPRTLAAAMPDQVDEAVKKARAKELRTLAGRKAQAFARRLARLDSLAVVLEDDDPWRGRCEYYVECRFDAPPEEASRRALMSARPIAARQTRLDVTQGAAAERDSPESAAFTPGGL